MFSTRTLLRFAVATTVAITAGLTTTACGTDRSRSGGQSALTSTVPEFVDVLGDRAKDYHSLADLSREASAVLVVSSPGQRSERPLPSPMGSPGSAPIVSYTLTVKSVVAGTIGTKDSITVVDGLPPATSGRSVFDGAGTFLVFVAPALYGPDQPMGGYAIVGGPAGIWANNTAETFIKLDSESPDLPDAIDLSSKGAVPSPTRGEQEILHAGG